MRSLSTFEFHTGAIWTNQFNWSPVRQVNKRTTAGGLVVNAQTLQNGQSINIDYLEGEAWLYYADVLALKAIAQTPGIVYNFTWDTQQSQVVFDHSNDDAVIFTPLVNRYESEKCRYFGQIKLITV